MRVRLERISLRYFRLTPLSCRFSCLDFYGSEFFNRIGQEQTNKTHHPSLRHPLIADIWIRRAEITWSRCLKRLLGVETCPACGVMVRIFVCIEAPVLIEKILTHLHAEQGPEGAQPTKKNVPANGQLGWIPAATRRLDAVRWPVGRRTRV